MALHISLTSFKMSSSLLSTVPILLSLFILQTNFISSNAIETIAAWNMTDTKTFPACVSDEECVTLDKKKGNSPQTHVCLQYFCYPWEEKSVAADKKPKLPFKGCRRSKDCIVNNKKGHCFRHHDRRNINSGICLKKAPKRCDSHDECRGSGGKCCSSYCCNDKYFSEIKKFPCTKDAVCKDLLMGDNCCVDLMGSVGGWKTGKTNWQKTCCTNPKGPLVKPPADMSNEDIKKINTQIGRMGTVQSGLQDSICDSMDYPLMTKFTECHHLTTPKPTTPSTTTSTTTTTIKTKQPKKNAVTAAAISISPTKIILTIISLNLLFSTF